ncbi:unnamed protein product [Effrenium voratum]|uniref:Pseudouridine synthase RsuA/RluA-like domain-containing protein n=1 Tax=Effrenium voratum TaxID=2562239 RepID=A0AA36J8E2_9DINO|nr:unnamed protein product [Effrenium voratum]CAJ1423686.1 unnamed protein product [Effrenium voratum]
MAAEPSGPAEEEAADEPDEEPDVEEAEVPEAEAEGAPHLFAWALARWPAMGSHQRAKSYARSGRLRVNGQEVADFHRLHAGDVVTWRRSAEVLALGRTFLRRYQVEEQHAGLRLEAVCKLAFQDLLPSRRSLRAAVKQQAVLVDGSPVEHTRILHAGAQVQLRLPAVEALRALCPRCCWPRVVYEDNFLAVVWKEPQVKSTGGWQSVENGARLVCEASKAPDALEERLKAVHRLDKPVAGLMLMAKTRSCHQELTARLRERRGITKTYRAVVQGHPTATKTEEGWFQVELPIEGRPCLTLFRSLERYPDCSVLELRPVTGRRHQLRVHMAALGCPMLGDCEHGGRKGFPLLLVSLALSFQHPATSAHLEFQEEEPENFQRWRASR